MWCAPTNTGPFFTRASAMLMMTTCNSHEFYIKKKKKKTREKSRAQFVCGGGRERDANAEMRCCNKCVSENDARRTCLHAPVADNDKVRTQITLANLIYGLGASDLTLARTGGSRRCFSIFAAADRSAIFYPAVNCDIFSGDLKKAHVTEIKIL